LDSVGDFSVRQIFWQVVYALIKNKENETLAGVFLGWRFPSLSREEQNVR